MTGKQLCRLLKLKAEHALYREDGKWYHQLKAFPGALFDSNGYLLFETKALYLANPYLQRGNDLHVKDGISSINGYKLFPPEIRMLLEQYIKPQQPADDLGTIAVNKLNDSSLSADKSVRMNKIFTFTPNDPDNPISVFRNTNVEIEAKEVCKLHREISQGLYYFLLAKFGKDNISCDCPTTNGTYIDMVRKVDGAFIFYEIKTYNGLLKSIREAFGQLMEYAYLDCKKIVSEMVIVSNKAPHSTIVRYLEFIRSNFLIPIYYQRFSLKKGVLSKKH